MPDEGLNPVIHSDQALPYPDVMPSPGKYRYCPMCRTPLGTYEDQEGIERIHCPACAWTYFPANVLGVNIVPVSAGGDVVVIFPPGEPADAPVAFPGGVVEYGESPEEAAVRETFEETGLQVEITRELGRWFDPNFPYGPMLSVMFEARVVGGELTGSHEGSTGTFRPSQMPPISPNRGGSLRAWRAYTETA